MKRSPAPHRLPKWVRVAWLPGALLLAALIAVSLRYGESARFAELRCIGNLWVRSHLKPVILPAVTVVSLITAVIPVTLLWLTRGGARGVPPWIRRFPGLKPVLEAIESAPNETLHDRRLLLRASALQFAIVVLDAATLRAMLLAIGVTIPPEVAFVSFTLASIAATVTLLPGGVGPFEAGSVGTLRLFGVHLEAAVAAT